jgi:hypothetical protein
MCRLSEASLFILSRISAIDVAELAGTTQLTNHEMYRISTESRRPMMKPVSWRSRFSDSHATEKPR